MLLTLGAAVLLWAASSLDWLEQRYQTSFAREDTQIVDGAQLHPELVPIALAALAAVAAVLATGGWLRRVVGILVVLAGAVLGWRAADGFTFDAGPYEGVPEGATPIGTADFQVLGPVLVAVAAVLLLAAGVLVVFRAGRMPAMGAKYSAPGTAKERVKDPDRQMWDDLDEGWDPTEQNRDDKDH